MANLYAYVEGDAPTKATRQAHSFIEIAAMTRQGKVTVTLNEGGEFTLSVRELDGVALVVLQGNVNERDEYVINPYADDALAWRPST